MSCENRKLEVVLNERSRIEMVINNNRDTIDMILSSVRSRFEVILPFVPLNDYLRWGENSNDLLMYDGLGGYILYK